MPASKNAGATTGRRNAGGANGNTSAQRSGASGSASDQQSQQPSQQQSQQQRAAGNQDREQGIPVSGESTRSSAAANRGGVNTSPDSFSFPSGSESYSSPFTFMRRFSEEMDRLFEDFGYGPAISNAFASPATGYQRTGRSIGNSGQRSIGTGTGSSVARRQGSQDLLQRGTWYPQVEILQRGQNLVVRADLPGIKREDVHIELEDGMLTLRGSRQNESTEEREGFYHSERSYGSFARVIPLPPGVEGAECKAKFDNGVLEVTIPLPEESSRARRIEIE